MISIIIPAYNEEGYIEKTLKSVREQNFKDYELIVICNGCSDSTLRIAKKYTPLVYHLKEMDLVKARNFGAEMAKGDLLIFLDADTYFLDADSLSSLIHNRKYQIGTCKFFPDRASIKHKSFSLIKNFACLFGMINGILFCERDLFRKTGGFDQNSEPKENHRLIRKARKYAKFQVLPHLVVTSMRRHEKWGYWRYSTYWIKVALLNGHGRYAAIR